MADIDLNLEVTGGVDKDPRGFITLKALKEDAIEFEKVGSSNSTKYYYKERKLPFPSVEKANQVARGLRVLIPICKEIRNKELNRLGASETYFSNLVKTHKGVYFLKRNGPKYTGKAVEYYESGELRKSFRPSRWIA